MKIEQFTGNLIVPVSKDKILIREAGSIFTTIDPRFKKINEDQGSNKKVVKETICRVYSISPEDDEQFCEYSLWAQVYGVREKEEKTEFLLCTQDFVVDFCKIHRDLLIGENTRTRFCSRDEKQGGYTMCVHSRLSGGKASLEISPINLNDLRIAHTSGDMRIVVVLDAVFTDGTKFSDRLPRKTKEK